MAPVIDYAWSHPSIAALRAVGAIAVCRYLSYDPSKNLTPTEAAVLTTAGFWIVSNWEAAGSWSEFSGGRSKGAQHAVEANRQHLACGGPSGRPILFSCDFDATATQLPVIADYYRGVASVIGLSRTGAYGSYSVIKYLFDARVITWAWQTYAWSAGRWDTRAQLRQIRNGILIGGADCDMNESRTADFGQWGTSIGAEMIDYSQPVPPGPAQAGNPGRTVGQLMGDVWSQTFGMPSQIAGLMAKLDVIAAVVDVIAARVNISPAELETIATAAREGAATGAPGPSAGEIVTELLARLPANADLSRADVEAAVQDALRAGTNPR